MKGFMKDDQFHPITPYTKKGTRKSRDQSEKTEGVKVTRKKRFENSKIQSLIFQKNKFNVTEAKEWASDHGFTAVKVEPVRDTLRIRQFSPNKIKRGGECRTIQFGGSGVQGVLCETPERFAKEGLSTSLSSIIAPPKIPPEVLIKEINDDLDFRKQLITKNEELKTEIKTDPQGEFTKGAREEFIANAKEIQQVGKEIKNAFNHLPKENKEKLDRNIINQLRLIK